MIATSFRIGLATCVFCLAGVFGRAAAHVQEPAAEDSREAAAAKYLQSVADALRVRRMDRADGESSKLPGTPLMKYSDPARGYLAAGVWRLGDAGRPLGLILFEYWTPRGGRGASISYELASFTPSKLEVTSAQGPLELRTDGGCAEFAALDGAPKPAATERQRLAQMRSLIRRFSSSEHGGGSSYVLRLVPQPIDRYQDAANGILDGAAFVFAYGTNPELVVLIECDSERWRYAAMRLSSAEVVVAIDDREVARFSEVTAAALRGAYQNGRYVAGENENKR